MISAFARIDKNSTGKLCEAMALTAFLSEGLTVALPYGNQAGWDLLVEAEFRWLKVQVKSVHVSVGRAVFTVDLRRCGSRKRQSQIGYAASEVDLIVAVLPETNTLWKIPISFAANKLRVALDDSFIWHIGSLPIRSAIPQPIASARRIGIARASKFRLRLEHAGGLPTSCPSTMQPVTFDMLSKFANGFTYL